MVFGKLKLCFLGTAASIHTLKWASYFAMMGHETHICSYEPVLLGYDLGDIKFHLLKKRVVINTWPFNSIINLPFARKIIKKLIREIKPDILHSHYVTRKSWCFVWVSSVCSYGLGIRYFTGPAKVFTV